MRRKQFIRNKHQLGKKASIKSLKRYCMEIWSEIIRFRDKNKCVLCGNYKYVQAHHLISRKYAPTRYDINCGVSVCSGCHVFRMTSVHVAPWILYEWLEKNRPEQYKWFIENRVGVLNPKKMKLDINFYREKLKYLLSEFEKLAPQEIKKCKYSKFLEKEEKEICKDYIENLLSRRDLASKYMTTEQTIETILKRNNIQMRKPGTRSKQFMELKKEKNIYDEPSGKI